MQETRTNRGIIALSLWTVLLIIIVAVVVWSEYKSDHVGTWIALCAGGFVFWSIGLVFVGRGGPSEAESQFTESCGQFGLKEFYLNGCLFQPYEQETRDGQRKFRLLSVPRISPEREAAVIRYLINEGLSEVLWPQISRRIKEEANWAFFA